MKKIDLLIRNSNMKKSENSDHTVIENVQKLILILKYS